MKKRIVPIMRLSLALVIFPEFCWRVHPGEPPFIVKPHPVETLSSNPHFFTVVNGQLFFIATDDDHVEKLWVSDGTVSFTFKLYMLALGGNCGGAMGPRQGPC